MNTGTEDGGGVTRVGERCFFMVGSHVAHDCQIGNQVTFANNVTLGGHVTIGDGAFLGGLAAVHQYGRVGEGAMIGGMSPIRADVIPFSMAYREDLVGLNVGWAASPWRDASADASTTARLSPIVFRQRYFRREG